MPIRPEGFSTGKPAIPTATPSAGPTIQLASGENMELSWQERSLCAQTDPEAFFPEQDGRKKAIRDRGDPTGRTARLKSCLSPSRRFDSFSL